MIKKCLLFLCLINLACSPKLTTVVMNQQEEAWDEKQGFVIFDEKDTTDLSHFRLVANLKAGDAGMTLKCDYYTMLNLVKLEAMSYGANAVKIVKYTPPNYWSTCHRFVTTAYYIEDLWKYEKEINWTDSRKLEIRDFKSSPEDRPFQAQTSSFIKYHFENAAQKGYLNLIFEAVFNTERSYFKSGEFDEEVLRHEQNHFNITEIYARTAVKRFKEKNIKNLKDLEKNFTSILEEIADEMDRLQDKYDAEVYPNPALEEKWNLYVEEQLELLDPYSDKILFIRVK